MTEEWLIAPPHVFNNVSLQYGQLDLNAVNSKQLWTDILLKFSHRDGWKSLLTSFSIRAMYSSNKAIRVFGWYFCFLNGSMINPTSGLSKSSSRYLDNNWWRISWSFRLVDEWYDDFPITLWDLACHSLGLNDSPVENCARFPPRVTLHISGAVPRLFVLYFNKKKRTESLYFIFPVICTGYHTSQICYTDCYTFFAHIMT